MSFEDPDIATTLGWLSDPKAVEHAIAEYLRIGRAAFLRRYGFGPAKEFFVRAGEYDLDSKAIAGAAIGYQFPKKGPLGFGAFTGGEAVKGRLEHLGFKVRRTSRPRLAPEPAFGDRSSTLLLEGEVYTRADLAAMFEIGDATLKNGVFHPKGTSSIWLFVTGDKTRDRTQYKDTLDGDLLNWEGQSQGRTDRMVIEHELRGLEVLVFYRQRIYEFRGAGFRYEGSFVYRDHAGPLPTKFTFERLSARGDDGGGAVEAGLDPTSVEDGRDTVLRAITARRGQARFRVKLLKAYGGCCVTGCAAEDVLEAAHIHPYRGEKTNVTSNGLLLRADIHTLFDLFLLGIDPASRTVMIAPKLRGSEYEKLEGVRVREPARFSERPTAELLKWHVQQMVR